MNAIDIKLWRVLWNMRLQALAISLVIVSGIGVFIMSLSTYDSLYETRESYYRDHRFADIFTTLKRAPLSVVSHIKAIQGVDKVDARVLTYVNLDIAGYDQPVSGHLISLPNNSTGQLNQILLKTGRLLESDRNNEIILSKEFAKAHALSEGDKITAIINGRSQALTIIGTAMSPEYIYQIAPGAMFPNYKSYGVMWMAQAPLASAFDMKGAFNSLSLTLNKGVNTEDIIDQLDQILKPYGGTGAYARKDQISNQFLTEELNLLHNMATMFPIIFFGVAAFLLNMIISRLIALEREQIAVLKAFGYRNRDIALHYSKLVLMITAFGILFGILLGIWMGKSMSLLYMDIYSLPYMLYQLNPDIIAYAILISISVAIMGTLYSVKQAAKLSPAQGMRPEQTTLYRQTFIERFGLQRYFSPLSRMILRHIERRPLKALLTTLGLSMALGIIMVGRFQEGAINKMIDVQYNLSQREDLMALYAEPLSQDSLYSLQSIQGVKYAEGFRYVKAKLSFEHRSFRTSVNGIEPNSQLTRLLDRNLQEITLPKNGVIITDYLAQKLQINTGDLLTIETLEGNRPVFKVPVIGTTKQYIGLTAYMQRHTLNQLLKEGDVISGAYLTVDSKYQSIAYKKIKDMPKIVGVVEQNASISAFYDTMDDTILFFTFITTLLGASIAFGVVYNSLRIALSERNRELASLRVLGFQRREVAYILLGEQGLLTLIAIPFGFVIGYGLCFYLTIGFENDLYRVPLELTPNVYALAAFVVIVSSIVSAMIIWRSLAHLDMVAVLKSKE